MALGMGFRCPAPKNPSSTTLPINTATRALGKDEWDALWKGCSRISPCSLRAPRVKSLLPRAKSFSCTNKSGLLPRAAALHHPRVAVHHLCHRDELRGPRRHITCAEYFMGERTASWLGPAQKELLQQLETSCWGAEGLGMRRGPRAVAPPLHPGPAPMPPCALLAPSPRARANGFPTKLLTPKNPQHKDGAGDRLDTKLFVWQTR